MKTVFIFDLGGVLINLNVRRCMSAFEALMGEATMRAVLGMDSNGEGVKAVSVASKQLMADFERGLISQDDFVAEVLSYCHSGATAQQVTDAWMSMLEDLPAERLAAVDELRKNHPVYLLSNGNDLHFNYIERTLLDTACAQRGVSDTRLPAHFNGVYHSHMVFLVDDSIILRVEPLKLGKQWFQALFVPHFLYSAAHLIANVGDDVDATAHRVDIHHRPTAHHCPLALRPQLWQ